MLALAYLGLISRKKPLTQQWLKYQKQNKKKLGLIKTQSMIRRYKNYVLACFTMN